MAKYSEDKTMEVTFSPNPSIKDHPGANNLCTKIDSFSFEGPNGTHPCLVFEPLGRSFEEIIDIVSHAARDPEYEPGKYGTRKWLTRFGREACRQVVLGLDYLHSHKIMHRDFQPGNILLALTYNLDALTKDEIQRDIWDDEDEEGDQRTMTKSKWAEMNFRRQADYINMIERKDGKPLAAHDPLYTVAAISLLDKVEFGPDSPIDFCVKLTDLGSACRFENCNDGKTPYPFDVRAPEIILQQPYNEKADIWALACTLFRIVTLKPLIALWATLDKEVTDDENMKNLIDRFGKLPEDIRSKWTRADQHLDKEGNLLEPDPYRADNYQFGDLWQAVRLAKPEDMSDSEAKVFYDLMKTMLDYDPSKRPSTKKVLKHPWFQMEKLDCN